MYCIIMNYNTATIDVLELPNNDFWDEASIEEWAEYDLKDSYFMLVDEKPHLNFLKD